MCFPILQLHFFSVFIHNHTNIVISIIWIYISISSLNYSYTYIFLFLQSPSSISIHQFSLIFSFMFVPTVRRGISISYSSLKKWNYISPHMHHIIFVRNEFHFLQYIQTIPFYCELKYVCPHFTFSLSIFHPLKLVHQSFHIRVNSSHVPNLISMCILHIS